MQRKVLLLGDPGIDGAFAIALALHDPNMDVLGLAATAGNVSAEQATRNMHCLVEHFDPPKWPRIGEALPAAYEVDGRLLHGPDGLGGANLPCIELHHPHPADKLIVDLVRNQPGEVTVVVMGPLSTLAQALDRDPELAKLVKQFIILGGSWREPGNVTAAAEFRFYCDPLAARRVLKSGVPTTLIPLDVMQMALFPPKDLLEIPRGDSPTCRLLRKIAPYGVGASANKYGIEGFYLQDVLGVCAASIPEAFKIKPMSVDVETRGELTRGMSVFDVRREPKPTPNVDVATEVDAKMVRNYMEQVFGRLSDEEE
jgi:inosine-uridine nucleoside N-ribohydrolase